MIGDRPIAGGPIAARADVPLPQYPRVVLPGLSVAAAGAAAAGGVGALLLPALSAAASGTAAIPVAGRAASRWRLDEYARVRGRHAALAQVLERSRVGGGHASAWALTLAGRHTADWAQLADVSARHLADWAQLDYTRASARHVAATSMHGADFRFVSGSVYAAHKGRELALVGELEVSHDDGAALWACDLSLARAEDYARVALGDPLTLHAYGSEYQLVVISRQLTRGMPPAFSLSCLSPAALLDAPWAESVRVAERGKAHETVEALLGAPIIWDMVDWDLTGDAASMDGTPLQLGRAIVAAAGGRLESLPDGSLKARAAWPVSVPAWPAAVPIATLTEADILAHTDSAEVLEVVDRLVITSGSEQASGSVQIEAALHEDDPQVATVRAWPWPWRPIELVHTGDEQTQVTARQQAQTEHDELVQVLGGAGNTRYPVHTVLDASWQYADRGDWSADGARISTASAAANGLLKVRYKALCWEWEVADPRVGEVLFLALEVES